jgi:hypothetical protein
VSAWTGAIKLVGGALNASPISKRESCANSSLAFKAQATLSKKYFKTGGVIERRKTPWSDDIRNLAFVAG